MTSKYGNIKTEVDGVVFDSKREAARYEDLLLLERAGKISGLRLQPAYELQPAFKRDGRTIRAIRYVGDFEYQEDGRTVCEDSKGMQTAAFKLKWKLVRFSFRDIDFRLV